MKMNKINIVFFIYKYLKIADQYVENIIRRVKKYRQYDSTQSIEGSRIPFIRRSRYIKHPPPFKKRWGEMGGEEKRARAWGTVFNELLQYLKKAQGLHQNKHKQT